MILYSHGAISSMLQAAELAASQSLAEANYAFLKRLTEVLVALGTQLCSLFGKEEGVVKPDTFALYLQAVLALTRHPSISINYTATGLWLALFRHECISTDQELFGILHAWINVVAHKLIKVGYPSHNDHLACAYSRLDFESDEEFSTFQHRFRVDMLEGVRLATTIAPVVAFSCAEHWLHNQLEKPVPDELCTPSSPLVMEWEALAVFLDCVVSKYFASMTKEGGQSALPVSPSGLQLLERCLHYQSNDPLILSSLLSCVSAMFCFVKQNPQRLEGNQIATRIVVK